MIVITQHRNRKLYVSDANRYTNLTEIRKLVQSGEKIRVVTMTGEDVTAHILSQVLVMSNNLSVDKLARLIQEGRNE